MEKKHEVLKYIGISMLILIGAFLAFYFVVDMSMKQMMSPEYRIHQIDKMMRKDIHRMERLDKRAMMKADMEEHEMNSFVKLKKEDDAYKLCINLKMVGDNEKNIELKTDGNSITIEGAVEKRKMRGEQLTKFSQTYFVEDPILSEGITKEKIHNKLIYTIPIKD